jgi:hypothetical protein
MTISKALILCRSPYIPEPIRAQEYIKAGGVLDVSS